ncbi:MAG TPA: D-alanyl-D-alanine carboxypeptidase [Pyrinomonadaceae bacterium]|jgi:D-alanyl-D-alanine carboxypeptidase/D-alanyl-D-alanine-endopeptidase (penicillin-binding protein 4)
MIISPVLKSFRFSFALLFVFSAFAAGNPALAQDVYTRPSGSPQPGSSPLVKPIVKQSPALVTQPSLPRTTPPAGTTNNSAAPNTLAPDVAAPSLEPVIGGMRGLLVETVQGQVLMENSVDMAFNPASNIKLATALAVLSTLKANYRFKTQIYTDGIIDTTTGTITGNLIVTGSDPSLQYEHAMVVADALNKIGIQKVTGDLMVASQFTINYNPSALRSGVVFYDTMDATRRSAAAVNAWHNYLKTNSPNQPRPIPSVAVMGAVTADVLPTNLRLLATHESSPLKDILKACLSYSNNFLAERLGDSVGGTYGVQNIVIREAKIPFEEFQIASTSGLGTNRVTPRAMMKIFRALQNELVKNKLSPTDIMPVAGIDEGTLKNRFTDYRSRGSVIGKTGTLPQTDSGVSSLVGQMATAKGEILYFVIFNQRGNVSRFRDYQNDFVNYVQNMRGGAATFSYVPKDFDTLLSNSRISIDKSFGNSQTAKPE